MIASKSLPIDGTGQEMIEKLISEALIYWLVICET